MGSDADQPPRILCIDDFEEYGEMLTERLQRLPARIDVALNGYQAITRLSDAFDANDPYRIIILDRHVPRNACEPVDESFTTTFLRDLQNAYRVIPASCAVIILTGNASYADCVACMKAGATDYLQKSDENLGDHTMLDDLEEKCRQVLLNPVRNVHPVREWVEQFWDSVMTQFRGSFIAPVELEDAAALKLVGDQLGGYLVLQDSSYENLRRRILTDPRLVWKFPPIINVPGEPK